MSKDLISHGHLGICIDCKSGGMRMRNRGITSAHSWNVLEKIAVVTHTFSIPRLTSPGTSKDADQSALQTQCSDEDATR